MIVDLVCGCCAPETPPDLASKLASRAGSISCVQVLRNHATSISGFADKAGAPARGSSFYNNV
jgi:hypothetical protein